MDRLQDEASPEDIVRAAIATGSRSIAYTYNDPVIFLEYAVDVAKVARKHGIKNIAVTAGYVGSGAREELYSWMDAANVDLKAFTEEFYKRLCTGRSEKKCRSGRSPRAGSPQRRCSQGRALWP
jgi:pyruvate formate lyase activating enzyme